MSRRKFAIRRLDIAQSGKGVRYLNRSTKLVQTSPGEQMHVAACAGAEPSLIANQAASVTVDRSIGYSAVEEHFNIPEQLWL